MEILDKTVLITGGGRGVGLEIAKAFAARGAKVAICGRNEDTLKTAAALIGADTHYFVADLAMMDAPEQIAKQVKAHFGKLDILINNAGIQLNYSVFDRRYSDISQDIDKEFQVDLIAPIKLAVALLPLMHRSQSGAIINIGSGLALAPKTSAAIYCASKAGLRSFTRALRYQAEQSAKNLRVVDVVLPMVATDMTAGRGSGKIAPAVVATQLIKSLAAGRDEILIGKTSIFSIIMRLAPKLGYRILKGEPVAGSHIPTTS